MAKITKKITENKQKQLKEAIDFIEELSWFFDSRKINLMKGIPGIFEELLVQNTNVLPDKFVSPNPNKHFLIGSLPRLFQDKNLFPSNEDIADFARSVLKLNVSRSEKRSKYELIGLIVCETNDLNESNLANLVNALEKITNNIDGFKRILAEKNTSTFSWNDAINKIANSYSND